MARAFKISNPPPPPPGPVARPVLPTDAELNRMMRIANGAARSGLGGCGTPQEAFAKLLTGWSAGIDAGTALNNIRLVDGRMTIPELVKAAAVRRSGIGDVRTVEVTEDHATVAVTRADWPEGKVELVTFGVADAVRAGLMTVDSKGGNTSRRDNWRKYAPDMLLARARGTALRRYLEEASAGLPYSPDELGADTDEDGGIVELDKTTYTAMVAAPLPTVLAATPPASDPRPVGNADPLPALQDLPRAALPAGGSGDGQQAAQPTQADPVADELQAIGERNLAVERMEKARSIMCLLRWDTPTYRAFLRHHFGADSMKAMNETQQSAVIAHMDRLYRLEIAGREYGVVDGFARACEKRGVAHFYELTPEHVQGMLSTMLATITPERQLQIGLAGFCDGGGWGDTGAGAEGNGSRPATAGAATPARETVSQEPRTGSPLLPTTDMTMPVIQESATEEL